jgi:hypothetical protein
MRLGCNYCKLQISLNRRGRKKLAGYVEKRQKEGAAAVLSAFKSLVVAVHVPMSLGLPLLPALSAFKSLVDSTFLFHRVVVH